MSSVSVVLACVVAGSIAGCGGHAQAREARELENASILSKTAPLENRLVTQSEIASAPARTATRSFLELWSLLQYQAWDRAAEYFQAGLRSAIGTSLLAQALEAYVLIWQATKPRIVSTTVAHGSTWIAFLGRDENDNVMSASISLQGSPGKWRVAYFSLLNGALERSVQQHVQATLDPLATKPNAEAVRQGIAAGALQDAYLARQERERRKGAPETAAGP